MSPVLDLDKSKVSDVSASLIANIMTGPEERDALQPLFK